MPNVLKGSETVLQIPTTTVYMDWKTISMLINRANIKDYANIVNVCELI